MTTSTRAQAEQLVSELFAGAPLAWMQASIKRVAAELLRQRLEEQQKHGGHMHGCHGLFRGADCDCGYRERIADLERQLKELGHDAR